MRDRLLHGDGRLLTLSGAGGVGKTSVALEVARQVESTLSDGARLIDLAVLREPDALALAACEALGLKETGGRPPEAILADYLAPRQMLLLLDNCEHLLPSLAELVNRLLDRCPDLRVLATSRAPLRVKGEAVVALPSLTYPDAEPNRDDLAAIPAVELFVERARAANSSFVLDHSNASSIASICRRLAGLPLAIELAAAQSAALTPAEIDARLEQNATLGRPTAGLPERQQTMEATLDWSYELLEAGEQALFRRLSVFAGGWTLEAAEQVCSLGSDAAHVAPALLMLVEHSLVVRDGMNGSGRFRMLTPVAEYARRRLAQDPEELDATSLAHAQLYLALASGGTPGWKPGDPQLLEVIGREYDNCLAALLFAESARIVPLVLGFNVALLSFWGVRGHLHSAVRRLEVALEIVGEAPSPGRGYVLGGLANYSRELGDHKRAFSLAQEAERIFQAAGDPIGLPTAIGIQGDVAADMGEFDEALAHYERVRPLLQVAGAGLLSEMWHANVGDIHRRRGDLDSARRELDQAHALVVSAGSWYLRTKVPILLADLARREGQLDVAGGLLDEALASALLYGSRLQVVRCLEGLARVALAHPDHSRAATLLASAIALRDAMGWQSTADEQAELAVDLDLLHSSLSAVAFEQAWATGLRLTLEQAVDLARRPAATPTPARVELVEVLTRREREIAELVAQGLTNPQIADQLFISVATVRSHVERILGKLGLTSRVQVATWIVREEISG